MTEPTIQGHDQHGARHDHDPHGIRASADNPGLLIAVFVAIAALSLVNVGASIALKPTQFALPMQLMIASVQAGLVAYYFMHLRHGDKVVVLTALSSLFWMGILFVLFMGDYMTRHLLITP